jgi:hypothetical protein
MEDRILSIAGGGSRLSQQRRGSKNFLHATT